MLSQNFGIGRIAGGATMPCQRAQAGTRSLRGGPIGLATATSSSELVEDRDRGGVVAVEHVLQHIATSIASRSASRAQGKIGIQNKVRA
jgi:hypothetical protein